MKKILLATTVALVLLTGCTEEKKAPVQTETTTVEEVKKDVLVPVQTEATEEVKKDEAAATQVEAPKEETK